MFSTLSKLSAMFAILVAAAVPSFAQDGDASGSHEETQESSDASNQGNNDTSGAGAIENNGGKHGSY